MLPNNYYDLKKTNVFFKQNEMEREYKQKYI